MKNTRVMADRLSDLPEHLIHRILSFLSNKEATIFSASSKWLSSIWSSFPVIDFNWRSSNHDKNLMFFQSVHNSLERRRTVKSNFERLSFHVITNDHLNLPEVLENMLSFAIDKKIRELKLVWIRSDFIPDKSLSKEIFSVETIKKICFSGLKFDSKDLILSCPLIEEFTIFHCTGFKSIEVATCARFIKNLRITECSGLERIHMEEDSPASLESFSYTYHSKDKASLYCKIYINLASRKSLKSFQLEGAQVTEEWFLNQVSQFVSLEKLTLGFCRTIVRNMCINHERLKVFEIETMWSTRGC